MKRLAALMLTITALILAACSSVIERPGADAPLPTGTDGTVVVAVTANTGEIPRFDTLVFAPISSDGPRYQLIQATVDAGRDTALFVGTLPAGQYRIQQLIYHYDHGVKTLEPRTSETYPGVVDIAAGHSNDLGRIVVTAVGEHVWIGRSRRDSDCTALLHRLLPKNADALVALRRPGWRDPQPAGDGAEQHALSHPVGVQSMVELTDGSVVAASRVGTLLLRDRNGRWTRLDTGRLETLRWISRNPESEHQIVVAGELDTLLASGRDGRLRVVDTDALPAGDLVFVTPMPDLSWVVVLENRDHYFFYRTEGLDRPIWIKIGEQVRLVDAWNEHGRIWAWRTEQGFAYASSAGDLHDYEAAGGTWRATQLPDGGIITAVSTGFGGFVSVVSAASTELADLFSTVWVSTDFGHGWNRIATPFHLRPSPLERLPDGQLLAYGGSYGHYSVQASADGGQRWTLRSDELQPEDRLRATPTAGVFRISSPLSAVTDILHSTEGAQWTPEWSSQDNSPPDTAPLSDLRTQRRRS